MVELARKGLLEDLTPYIERDGIDMSQYYKVIIDSFRWRGRQYAMSMQFGAIGLYYNRDHFDKAGVGYPNTRWEQPGVDGDLGAVELELQRTVEIDLESVHAAFTHGILGTSCPGSSGKPLFSGSNGY